MTIIDFILNKKTIGIIFILFALGIFIFSTPLLAFITQIIAFFILLSVIEKFFNIGIRKTTNCFYIHLSNILISIIIPGLIFIYPDSILTFFGWWLLINSVLEYITFRSLLNNTTMPHVLPIILGVFLIFNPNIALDSIMEVMGIFLFVQGLLLIFLGANESVVR